MNFYDELLRSDGKWHRVLILISAAFLWAVSLFNGGAVPLGVYGCSYS
jgi:hypothetical protein